MTDKNVLFMFERQYDHKDLRPYDLEEYNLEDKFIEKIDRVNLTHNNFTKVAYLEGLL